MKTPGSERVEHLERVTRYYLDFEMSGVLIPEKVLQDIMKHQGILERLNRPPMQYLYWLSVAITSIQTEHANNS